MKTIVICGSMKVVPKMLEVKEGLESMGFAMCFDKKIFLLNPVPDQPNSVEIDGLLPVVLSGDLSLVK